MTLICSLTDKRPNTFLPQSLLHRNGDRRVSAVSAVHAAAGADLPDCDREDVRGVSRVTRFSEFCYKI